MVGIWGVFLPTASVRTCYFYNQEWYKEEWRTQWKLKLWPLAYTSHVVPFSYGSWRRCARALSPKKRGNSKMLDQVLFDSHAECPTFHAGNTVKSDLFCLKQQDVTKSLKWEVCSLDSLHMYYSWHAESLFLAFPVSACSNLTHPLRLSQTAPLPSRLAIG